MVTRLLYGPRRVSLRRIVGIPRALLRSAALDPPTRVALDADAESPETIVVAAVREGSAHVAAVSSVGQLVLPPSLVEMLNLGQQQMVYMRLRQPTVGIEVMSPRQGFVASAGRFASETS